MWDDRIDEAAHELTSGTPGADFKARVLERIERENVHARVWQWKRGLLWSAPLAAAAVLFIAIAIHRGNPESHLAVNDLATSGAERIRLKPDPTTDIPGGAIRLKPDPTTEVLASDDPTADITTALTVAADASLHVEPVPDDPDAIPFEPLMIAPIEIASVDSPETAIAPLILSEIEIRALAQ